MTSECNQLHAKRWRLMQEGKVLATFPTREQCAVKAFELGLVVTFRYGTRRELKPGVVIVEGSVP